MQDVNVHLSLLTEKEVRDCFYKILNLISPDYSKFRILTNFKDDGFVVSFDLGHPEHFDEHVNELFMKKRVVPSHYRNAKLVFSSDENTGVIYLDLAFVGLFSGINGKKIDLSNLSNEKDVQSSKILEILNELKKLALKKPLDRISKFLKVNIEYNPKETILLKDITRKYRESFPCEFNILDGVCDQSIEQKDDVEDSVNRPKHYQIVSKEELIKLVENNLGLESRDICKVLAHRLQKNNYDAMVISDYVQMLQYILRFDEKNGVEDLKKAEFYLKKIIEVL